MIWSGEVRSEGELVLKTGSQNCPQNCPQLQVKYVTKELVVDKDVEGLVKWKLGKVKTLVSRLLSLN